jgi:Hypervirulence associated proteins TUDOR domain
MPDEFKRGDHVEWNSEAGRDRGTIQKKVTSEIMFNGYKRHASNESPQYIIKCDKTDHLAIHKGSAIKKVKNRSR